MSDPSTLLTRFLQWKRAPTVDKCRSYLSRLLCFVRAKNIGLKDATYVVCDTFVDSLAQLASSSKRSIWSNLSSFFSEGATCLMPTSLKKQRVFR